MTTKDQRALIRLHNKTVSLAFRGASQVVESIEAMIRLADPDGKEDPAAMASVFVHNFFYAIKPSDSDTPLQRAIKAEITERVFPPKQA